MKPASTDHARFRELISERLDGRLPVNEQRQLAAHLRTCSRCAAVEHDYRDQRAALRGLADATPPRDLWARTSAALDREMARDGAHKRRRPLRARTLPRVLITSLGAIVIVLAVGVAQLPPPRADTTPGPAAALATPFVIPSQPLAFLASTDDGLALYRTQVDRVCPHAVPDCVDDAVMVPSVVALPRHLRPSELALSPSGRQLAIVGRDPGSEDVISVVLMPAEAPGGPVLPPRTEPPNVTATDPPPVETEPGNVGASPPPEATPGLQGSLPPETAAPPTAAVSGLTVLSILSDVRSAGAPPAWSADGSTLAFSAMPADESHGPDVYIWRPGDELAQPITSDHRSFFASWSGWRIVISRVAETAVVEPPAAESPEASAQPLGSPEPDGSAEPGSSAEPAVAEEHVAVTTVVIDPVTLEERVAGASDLWLPVVGPLGNHAITWFGTLTRDGHLVRPAAGALYVVDWAAVDPWADGATPAVTGEPEPDETAQPTPSQLPSGVSPPTTPRVPPNDARATPGAQNSAPPTQAGSEPSESVAPDPGPTTVPEGLSPLEPARDPQSRPVVDWQVRWTSDGSVLGYWVADTPGASWGELVVVPLDPETGALGHDTPLLAPTLARRGFSLGLSRVAWVAAGDGNPEGELRIRTWGRNGVGDIRLRPFDLREVVPTF